MAAVENANLTGNLHFRPLSSHLTRTVAFGATQIRQLAEENTWQVHVVDLISKGTLVVGACLALPLALIETITSLSLAIIGIGCSRYLFCNQIESLQKHSLKCLSFAMHSGITAIGNFIMALRRPELRYHTTNALIDNGIYLGTAAVVQLVIGSIIDQECGRPAELVMKRVLNLLTDSHPEVLQDVANQVERDFGITILGRLREFPALDEYLENHPEDREFLTNFDMQRLREDEYQREAFGFATRFLAEIRLIRPEAALGGEMRVELTQVTDIERLYQNTLCRIIRDSIIEVHTTPELAGHLNTPDSIGQDRIEMIDAQIIQPLLMYAQYKELTGVIQCPHHFTTDVLLPFNPRREKMMLAHAIIINLSENQRAQLREKILRGSDYEAEGAVQNAFLRISELATDLERGPMMTKSYIDLEHLEDGDLVTNQVLYQESWREALSEIERRREVEQA